MASTFAGVSIATRGLFSSQAGLSVTTNNISNVNTTGYSRQTVSQSAVSPAAVYSGSVGGGSQVTSIGQIREARLDQKYWRENASVGEWETKADTLSELESILGDMSEDGLSTVMEDFTEALEDLASDSGSSSARVVVQEMGNTICQYLNTLSQKLTDLQADVNGDIKTSVGSVNSYATQIASLNQQIRQASQNGADANELNDRRTVLIDELSKLADIEVGEVVVGTQIDGTQDTIVSINVNGNALVIGDKARQLAVQEADSGMYEIYWQDSNEPFNPGGGVIQADLELRDGAGSGSDYKGVVYYMDQLDEYARTFAKAFNEGIYQSSDPDYVGHAGGVGTDGTSGIRFFSYDGKSTAALLASGSDTDSIYTNVTAANISLSKDVIEDVNKIAAASSSGESGNNENVNELISICEDTKLFGLGSLEDYINSIISTVGSESSYAQRLSENYTNVLTNIETRRNSVSGVSTNEETANLTKYQQAYEASAKILSVWDEVYKETISLLDE